MKNMELALKPTSILLIIIFLLAPAYCRTASAAMIETNLLVAPEPKTDRRDFLQDLISRNDIQQVLVAHGVSPAEARARIDSLSDDELEIIFKDIENIADLPAGGNAVGFIVIVGAVILIVILIVEYFSDVKMFPSLHSDE
jgi:hypothetical protein